MATIEQRLAEYLAEYKDLFGKAQSYDMNQYQQDFQKAYNEAMDYNKDLIGQKSAALGELQAVAPTMRERYANSLITDPTRQMSLIAQARQAPITDWGQAVDLLGARGAKYSDILGKAVGGYQTAADQANIAAENAWRLYQDAVQQYQFQQQLRRSSGPTSGVTLKDILDAYSDTGGGGGDGGGFVDDKTFLGKVGNWTDKITSSDWLGADLTKAPTSVGGAILKGVQVLNPLTYIKTGAGLLGNLIGNRGTDKSFVDKLFDRR